MTIKDRLVSEKKRDSKESLLLTFAVPTYGRPESLRNLLKNVLPQLSSFKDEVEVLIKDDNVEDLTQVEALKLLDASEVPYRYFRGEKKGIDPANLFLAENSLGEFVWWCGDDDEVRPGVVERILELIRGTPDLSFIFINFIIEGNPKPVVLGGDRFIKDCNQFLNEVSVSMTLLSTGVFKRKEGMEAIDLGNKYIGTAFASQPLILQAISSGGKLYFLAGPYIVNHPTILKEGENLFYDGVETFGTTYFRLLKDFKHRFSYRAIRAYHKRNFGHIWRGLVVGWVRRNTEPPRRRIRELALYWTLPEFYLAVLIFLLPKKLVSFLLILYKKVVKRTYRQPK